MEGRERGKGRIGVERPSSFTKMVRSRDDECRDTPGYKEGRVFRRNRGAVGGAKDDHGPEGGQRRWRGLIPPGLSERGRKRGREQIVGIRDRKKRQYTAGEGWGGEASLKEGAAKLSRERGYVNQAQASPVRGLGNGFICNGAGKAVSAVNNGRGQNGVK